MRPFKTKKFEFSGGRGGYITFTEDDQPGRLEFELLASGAASIVIYSSGCWWLLAEPRKLEVDDLRRLVREFVDESRVAVEVDLPTGTELMAPLEPRRS